jgi:hypothetical protein
MEITADSMDRKFKQFLSVNQIFYFNRPAGNYGGNPGSYVKLSKYVSPENQDKCILMRGCPYRIEAKEIVAFFDGYGSLRRAALLAVKTPDLGHEGVIVSANAWRRPEEYLHSLRRH